MWRVHPARRLGDRRVSPNRRVNFGGPEGIYDSFGTPVAPDSLYIAQLKQTLGPQPTATAVHQYSVGPNTNFTGPSVTPYVDPAWQATAQSTDMPGSGSIVGFDNSTLNARRAATIQFNLAPQEKVVAGMLTLKIKALADLTTNDRFFMDSPGMDLDFDMMGQLPWSKNQIRTITIDLSDIYGPLLGPLQSSDINAGKFNLFFDGNVSVDFAAHAWDYWLHLRHVAHLERRRSELELDYRRNWSGTAAPSTGDSLVFDGVTGLNNVNNLPANTLLAAIKFNSTAGGSPSRAMPSHLVAILSINRLPHKHSPFRSHSIRRTLSAWPITAHSRFQARSPAVPLA